MTALYYIGILDVDRSKREFRVWVCRCYRGLGLPESHSFFAGILYWMFEDSGRGNVSTNRWYFQSIGKLPRPTAAAEAAVGWVDDGDNLFDAKGDLGLPDGAPADPSPFIEHVEMLRWCGPPDDNDDEYATQYHSQAEYIVRLTDSKYLSLSADPCFLGYYFFDTADVDDGRDTTRIPDGPYQETVIFPVEDFSVDTEQVQRCRDYYAHNLATVPQLLDVALPQLVAKDPNTFTQDLFPRLARDQQQLILSFMAFTKRQNTVLHYLNNKDILFHMFSFFNLQDAQRRADVKQVYMGLKYGTVTPTERTGRYDIDFDLLDYDNQIAMKHFSRSTIVRKLADICEQAEQRILQLHGNNQEDQARVVEAYLEDAKRIVQALQDDDTNRKSLMDDCLFPRRRHPLEWIRERVEAAASFGSTGEFVDHIKNVPPNVRGDE